MRFISDGPDIPDDLLIARDAGDVIFFCGAGVSQHRAKLPDFLTLGRDVISQLGAGKNSLAAKLCKRISEIGPMEGVGGLIATDRIFGLLERLFETEEVRAAVARSIMPADNADLGAHRLLLDLSRSRDRAVRLVTTNFALLFEACNMELACWGPPNLPDPRSAQFAGVVHLHGRVNDNYSGGLTRNSSSLAQISVVPTCPMDGRHATCRHCWRAFKSCSLATLPTTRSFNICSKPSTSAPAPGAVCSPFRVGRATRHGIFGNNGVSVRSRSTTARATIRSGIRSQPGPSGLETSTAGTSVSSPRPLGGQPMSSRTSEGRSRISFPRARAHVV
jgi:hypothetical protein